jgi:hypothetical protein
VRRRCHCVILLHRNGVTEELNVDLRGVETTHVCTDDNGPYRNGWDILKRAVAPFDCCTATVTPAPLAMLVLKTFKFGLYSLLPGVEYRLYKLG